MGATGAGPAAWVLRYAAAGVSPVCDAQIVTGDWGGRRFETRECPACIIYAGHGKGEVRSMGRSNGFPAVHCIAVMCMTLLLAVCSCIEEPMQDARQPVPDIVGNDGRTAAQLYRPENWYTQERLARLEATRYVAQTIASFAADGYRYTPDGSFVIAGADGEKQVEVALICLSNTVHPERDVIYLAAIDVGSGMGIAPARLSFERPLDGTASEPIADGVWLETLPYELSRAGSVESCRKQSERWNWEEFWRCHNTMVFSGSAGCAISCIPSFPSGYMMCYFTCVGGVTIAAIITCTLAQLFG